MGESSRSTDTRTPSGLGSTSTSTSFVAGDDKCEEKTVTLTIKNVAEYFEMSSEEMEENGLTFEAGRCTLRDGTRTLATWKYSFKRVTDGDGVFADVDVDGDNCLDWIGDFLTLKESKGKAVKSARAWHSVSLSSAGGTVIASYDSGECKEFAGVSGSRRQKFIKKSELLDKTKVTNSLEVTLLMKVFCYQGFKPVAVETPPPLLEAEVTEMQGEVNSDFGRLLESGIGADLEINVLHREVVGRGESPIYTKQAHKAVLMARSPVFAKMFEKDSKDVQAQSRVVDTWEWDLSPKGLDIFLHFLYTGKVLPDWVHVCEELIKVAEKYDCGKLKHYCGHNLHAAVTTANALDLLKFAKKHKLSYAQKNIMEFIQKNTKRVFTEDVVHKIAQVYTDTQ